jgi:hypothetical protein
VERKKLKNLFLFFYVKKDRDIESFLKNRAIKFEKLGKSRTFILFDEADPTATNIPKLSEKVTPYKLPLATSI